MNEIIPYNRNLKQYKVWLRNNMTGAEKLLWSKIKCKQIYGLQFCRQFPIDSYIIDFFCKPIKLAIEIDGPIHCTKEHVRSDANRDHVLKSYGIHVLRFTNEQIEYCMVQVLDVIRQTIRKKQP